VPFSLARRHAPSLLCGHARSYAVFVYCHPVVFTVAQYHSLVVLERSRIASRVLVSFGASDCHSLVVLVLLHARRGIVVVVFLHARCGMVVVVFLPARCGLRYAQQTSLMRGGLPSCPVRPSVCAVVFLSARGGMHGCLPFRLVWHRQRSSILSGAARYAWWCCLSVIGGPGSLVTLPDDLVIIGASDPRSRRCSRHTTQRCVKVGQGR